MPGTPGADSGLFRCTRAPGGSGLLVSSRKKKNFENLKNKIQQFTNSIFSPHDRNEGLIFRGLFFTASESVSGLNFNVDNQTVKLSLNSSALSFVRDLFTKKIFVEYNIAQPIFKTEIFNKTIEIGKKLNEDNKDLLSEVLCKYLDKEDVYKSLKDNVSLDLILSEKVEIIKKMGA